MPSYLTTNPALDIVKQKYKEIHGDPTFIQQVLDANGGYVDVLLSSAQLLASFATPVQLIPAPGASSVIMVEDILACLVYNSTTYAWNAGGAGLFYGATAANGATGHVLTQTFLQSASGTNLQAVRGSATAYTPAANQPVVFQASTANPTTGNSPLLIRVYFKIAPAVLS